MGLPRHVRSVRRPTKRLDIDVAFLRRVYPLRCRASSRPSPWDEQSLDRQEMSEGIDAARGGSPRAFSGARNQTSQPQPSAVSDAGLRIKHGRVFAPTVDRGLFRAAAWHATSSARSRFSQGRSGGVYRLLRFCAEDRLPASAWRSSFRGLGRADSFGLPSRRSSLASVVAGGYQQSRPPPLRRRRRTRSRSGPASFSVASDRVAG